MTKQIILWALSGIMTVVLVVGGIWTAVNFDNLARGMNGSNIYTKEDLEKAYNDGYNEAFKDKDDYLAEIAEYRDTIMILQDTLSHLNIQIASLQNQVSTLTASNTNKDGTISALNSQIATLQASITNLTIQVSSLTSTNIGLSTDLYNLNNQLAQIQGQALGYTTTINRLNSLVTYLTNIVIDWENRTEFLATFYVNGQIWDIQVINHINTAVTVPTSPVGNYAFIGWTLDGYTVIDPTQIPIVTDTNFQAVINVTATFVVDGVTHNTQTIKQNATPTMPSTPSGAFTFVGWSLDGNNVITLSAITQNTTYIAVYTYTVTFVNQGSTVKTEEVRHGQFATAPSNPTRTGYTFGGWSINGTTAVTVSSTVITSITTFTALWTVNTYNVNFVYYAGGTIVGTATYGSYATAPTNSLVYTGYDLAGWSLDGVTPINLSTTVITGETSFYALWTPQTYTVTYMFNGSVFGTEQVQYGSVATFAGTPTMTGYTFLGWIIGSTNGETLKIENDGTAQLLLSVLLPSIPMSPFYYHESRGNTGNTFARAVFIHNSVVY